jgi:hypothetical protein
MKADYACRIVADRKQRHAIVCSVVERFLDGLVEHAGAFLVFLINTAKRADLLYNISANTFL